MIREKKRWMTYTWFNPKPKWSLVTTFLFTPLEVKLPFMKRVPFRTMTISIRNDDFVKRWSSSTRNKVNRAIREQLTVDRGNFLMPEILLLFKATATLKGLRGYVEHDFDQIPHVECSAIYYEGVMLCSHIWVIDDDGRRALLYVNASNHHNPNDDNSLTGRAHYFLLWQDGLFLREKGIECMDLMGYEQVTTDPMLKGVYQWKAGTHGHTETLYHYYPFWFYWLRTLRKMVTG